MEAIIRDENCIVKAGPGTGKTRTLITKAAYLLYNKVFPPRGIACITFSKDMAKKLSDGLDNLCIGSKRQIFTGTNHAFALVHIVMPFGKLYGKPIPDKILVPTGKQQIELYEEVWNEGRFIINGYKLSDGDIEKERLPFKFQCYRRTQLDGMASSQSNTEVERLLTAYEKLLIANSFLDFDLQEKWAMEIVEQQPYVRSTIEAKFPWIMVDEYQDLGLPLHRIIRALAEDTNLNIKLFAIGDPNQCIYEFRGASPQYFKELCEKSDLYGNHIELTASFRFSKNILRVANAANPANPAVQLTVDHRENVRDGKAQLIKNVELKDVICEIIKRRGMPDNESLNEIMVLSHSWDTCNKIAKYLETELGLPCFKPQKDIFDYNKPLIEWLGKLAAFAIAGKSTDTIRFNELTNFWKTLLQNRGVPEPEVTNHSNHQWLYDALIESSSYIEDANTWIEFISSHLRFEHFLETYLHRDDVDEYVKLCDALGTDGKLSGISLQQLLSLIHIGNRIYIGTIFSRKGQESKITILVRAERLQWHETPTPAERRLFYVAITRPQEELYISHDGYSDLANEVFNNVA